MSDPTARYPEQPREPEQPPAYSPPPGYEEYAPRQQPHQQPSPPSYQQPYPPSSQEPYPQHPGAPSRPTSAVAVVGLVLAFVLSPVGVVVSAFGIGDTRDGRKAGRGLAVAGVVVGVVGTVLWVVAIIAAVALVRSTVQVASDVASSLESLPAPSDLPSGLPTDLGALGGEDGTADVVVDSCRALVAGAATGEVTITNSTDATASYVVNLNALDAAGEKVGELYAVQDDVAPGQSVQVQALGYAGDGAEVASCEVFQASRTAG